MDGRHLTEALQVEGLEASADRTAQRSLVVAAADLGGAVGLLADLVFLVELADRLLRAGRDALLLIDLLGLVVERREEGREARRDAVLTVELESAGDRLIR